MGIRFNKYIDILSGVGAGSVVATRELILRVFTTNPLLPTGSYIEFNTPDDVGAYFGTTSEEYKRAVKYFSFINKNISSPDKISFARWVNANTAPHVFGKRITASLTALQLITNGSFSLTMGVDTHVISALDFSGAASLADVAGIIEDGITAQTGIQWTGATVTYDVTRGSFDLVGGNAIAAVVSVAAGNVGTNIATTIGWMPQMTLTAPGAIWSDGALVETITETLTNSAQASNNFGSYLFIPSLTDDQIIESLTWNTAKDIFYQVMIRVVDTTKAQLYGDPETGILLGFAGGAMTYTPAALASEYHEQFPAMILAATNYNAINSTQNYMFQIFNATPSVTTNDLSDTLDTYRVNYYGQTQTAGQFLSFYQRGVLTGLPVHPVDMNIYANEQWLKDANGAALMTLLLALAKVSANAKGRAQIITILQSVIDQALSNGTISVDGVISTTQKLYIAEVTGSDTAWQQVQSIGFWLNCAIVPFVADSGITEYKAVYTLVYKKDDVIRKVDGTHVLI